MEDIGSSWFFEDELKHFQELPLQSTLQELQLAAKIAATDFGLEYVGSAKGKMHAQEPGKPTVGVCMLHSPSWANGDIDGSMRRLAIFDVAPSAYPNNKPEQFELWYDTKFITDEPFYELRSGERLCTENDACLLLGRNDARDEKAA